MANIFIPGDPKLCTYIYIYEYVICRYILYTYLYLGWYSGDGGDYIYYNNYVGKQLACRAQAKKASIKI